MAGSRGFPQRGGAGCRAGVRTLGKSARKSRHRFGVRGRVPMSAGYAQSPQPTLYAPKSAFETSRWHWPVCCILPSPKRTGESPAGSIAPPATSRRMSTRRSGGVTPPATAMRRLHPGLHRRKARDPKRHEGRGGALPVPLWEAASPGRNVYGVLGRPWILAMAGPVMNCAPGSRVSGISRSGPTGDHSRQLSRRPRLARRPRTAFLW